MDKSNVFGLNQAHDDIIKIVLKSDRFALDEWIMREGKKKRNMNAPRNQKGQTLLHIASFHNIALMCNMLMKAGADTEAKDEDGNTPLHLATTKATLSGRESKNKHESSYDTTIIKALIDGGSSVSAQNGRGRTPLMMAISNSCIPVAMFLLQHGGMDQLDVQDKNDNTALHLAIQKSYSELIHKIISLGASLNIKNDHMRTPLLLATALSAKDTVYHLLTNGADPNDADEKGLTPIQYAAGKSSIDIIRLLVQNGANINYLSENKECGESDKTALMIGSGMGNLNVVTELVKLNADINIKDSKGFTALTYAASTGRIEIVRFLLREKADSNLLDCSGHSPIHWAAKSKHKDIVTLLLSSSPSPLVSDTQQLINNLFPNNVSHLRVTVADRSSVDETPSPMPPPPEEEPKIPQPTKRRSLHNRRLSNTAEFHTANEFGNLPSLKRQQTTMQFQLLQSEKEMLKIKEIMLSVNLRLNDTLSATYDKLEELKGQLLSSDINSAISSADDLQALNSASRELAGKLEMIFTDDDPMI